MIPVADPGLQPERTAMSWTRTALAMLVCAAALLRWAGSYPALIVAASVALAAGALVIVALNRRAYRFEASALADERSAPNAAAVFLLSAMTLVTGGLGLYLVVSGVSAGAPS